MAMTAYDLCVKDGDGAMVHLYVRVGTDGHQPIWALWHWNCKKKDASQHNGQGYCSMRYDAVCNWTDENPGRFFEEAARVQWNVYYTQRFGRYSDQVLGVEHPTQPMPMYDAQAPHQQLPQIAYPTQPMSMPDARAFHPQIPGYAPVLSAYQQQPAAGFGNSPTTLYGPTSPSGYQNPSREGSTTPAQVACHDANQLNRTLRTPMRSS
ncbi:hypothetical protein EJ04DRAFT_563794 [Polyplosphaeria fusca]|uniref:Uncharacterized protein n=1 Tax=Polyplosphaeria fusca TaxID=682080 RepID=A0A9P4QW18_9PLEO|nr:hypothetical protein EJ04DRAFT_563794 [Polyplosphaeria fusca]